MTDDSLSRRVAWLGSARSPAAFTQRASFTRLEHRLQHRERSPAAVASSAARRRRRKTMSDDQLATTSVTAAAATAIDQDLDDARNNDRLSFAPARELRLSASIGGECRRRPFSNQQTVREHLAAFKFARFRSSPLSIRFVALSPSNRGDSRGLQTNARNDRRPSRQNSQFASTSGGGRSQRVDAAPLASRSSSVASQLELVGRGTREVGDDDDDDGGKQRAFCVFRSIEFASSAFGTRESVAVGRRETRPSSSGGRLRSLRDGATLDISGASNLDITLHCQCRASPSRAFDDASPLQQMNSFQ